MNIESRDTKHIISDISEIQDIIRTNEEALSIDSSSKSLEINLKKLYDTQEKLFDELIEAYDKEYLYSFDMVLDSTKIVNHKIPMSFLGQFSYIFQNTITSMAKSEYNENSRGPKSDRITKETQLNITATAPGSFRIIITTNKPYDKNTLGETVSLVESSLIKFNNLLDCGDNKKEIIDYIESFKGTDIIDNYKKFLEVLYKNKTNLVLYDKIRVKNFSRKELSHEFAYRIYKLIVEQENRENEEDFTGMITGYDIHKFEFKLMLNDDDIIPISFEEKWKHVIYDNIEKIVTVTVNVYKIEHDIYQKERRPKYKLVDISTEQKHKTHKKTFEQFKID